MKILQVMAGAPEGGAETAFIDFCIAQKQSGADVVVATRPNRLRVPALEKENIPVHQYPFGGKIDVFTPFALRRLIAREKPQIVQAWMARAAAKIPEWHGDECKKPYRVISRLGNYYKIKNFRQTDYFTTITPMIRDYLIENGVHPDRVRHINNFAETEDEVIPVQRSDLSTPEDAPVLLTLSRLHDSKGLDVLIKALVDLPGVYLWMAGDGPLRIELVSLAKKLGLADRVKFLGWRTDRAALLEATDVLVFPSRFEPFGTTFVQAWAHKVPLVTSDADGPRQFVKDGEDGLVVERDNIEHLRNAIDRVISNPDLKQSLIENGYRRYEGEFTKDKCLQAYMDFYQEILRRNEMETPIRQSAPA